MSRQSQQTVRAVRTPQVHASRAVAALTMAFGSDPVCRWVWSDPALYLASFPTFVQAFGGAAFAAETAFSIAECRGAALWLAPDASPDEQALVELIERSVPPAQRGAMFELLEQMATFHPEAPHWYLPLIGVEPSMQNRGLGEALLRPMLARCDETNMPAYLESTNPRNVPFYERLGFRTVGTLQVDACPPIVPMLRLPG